MIYGRATPKSTGWAVCSRCAGAKNCYPQVRGQVWYKPDHAWAPLDSDNRASIESGSLVLVGTGCGRADLEPARGRGGERQLGKVCCGNDGDLSRSCSQPCISLSFTWF